MVSMVDTREILERLEEQQRQERIKRFKGLVKMTFKDLRNLIKMAKNSGMDLEKVTLGEVLKQAGTPRTEL